MSNNSNRKQLAGSFKLQTSRSFKPRTSPAYCKLHQALEVTVWRLVLVSWLGDADVLVRGDPNPEECGACPSGWAITQHGGNF